VVDEIQVTVPAQPDFIHVVRSVTGAVAAGFQLPYDEIDDLRIAIDEACSHLLDVRPNAGVLRLAISTEESRIRFVASIEAPEAQWPPPNAHQTLTWQVLAALADDAEFAKTATGPGIQFSKRLPK
jgi:serine/threonine-protein kinase RsbW